MISASEIIDCDLDISLEEFEAMWGESDPKDEDGEIVAAYDYDVFGELLAEIGPKGKDFFHRYQTKPYDREVGLVYFGYRYYEPRTRKFLTRDPLGEAGTINMLAYCNNDPYNWYEYMGMAPERTRAFGEIPNWINGGLNIAKRTFGRANKVVKRNPGLSALAQGVSNTAQGVQNGVVETANLVPLAAESGISFAENIYGFNSPLSVPSVPNHQWARNLYTYQTEQEYFWSTFLLGEAGLFFATGGASSARHARHLRHLHPPVPFRARVASVKPNIDISGFLKKHPRFDFRNYEFSRLRLGLFDIFPQFKPPWRGSGPAPGVIGLHPNSVSSKALKNYNPKGGAIEFVFDPVNFRFAVGKPHKGLYHGSPHQQLAKSIGADDSTVVGGIFTKENGIISTHEASGHYWQNWTDEVRDMFVKELKAHGIEVNHRGGQF